jgi:hypothetical protein
VACAPKIARYSANACKGIFDSSPPPADQRPKHIAPTEATQQIRQTKLDLFPRLVAYQRPRLRHPRMEDFALGHDPCGEPLHNLGDKPLGHLVHGLEGGQGMVRHLVATRTKPLDEPACLHDQLPHLGEQARQPLALGLCALGKEVVFFDRREDRLHLCEGRLGAHDRPSFELHQGAPTALGPPPYAPGFVGIPNRQLLDSGIRGQDTDIGKPIVLGHMPNQPVDLLHAICAQGRKGAGDVGVVSYLGVGIGLAAYEHPCHDIFGHVCFHRAGVEMFHQHQDHQGHVQSYIPG